MADPRAFGGLTGPDGYFELRLKIAQAMDLSEDQQGVLVGEVEVGSPADWPWRGHVKLIRTFPTGIVSECSGVLIDARHVLSVEDVTDTRLSLRYIVRSLETRQPASLRICTLFNKPRIRLFELDVAYTGFVLPDKFVVGYGLDYEEQYRNLPFVGVLHEKVITRRRLPSNPHS